MHELNQTLDQIGIAQLLLALLFLGAYAMVLGGSVGASGQVAAGVVSLLSAAGFVFLTDPWVHGILLVAAVVIGVGVFIALAWLLMALTGRATGADAEHLAAFPSMTLSEDLEAAPQVATHPVRGEPLLTPSASAPAP
jgi:hypothetical protein